MCRIADHQQFAVFVTIANVVAHFWRNGGLQGSLVAIQFAYREGALHINETKGRGQELSALAVMIVDGADCDKILGLDFQAFDVVGCKLDALLGHVSHDFLRRPLAPDALA